MKRFNNLYSQIADRENIKLAHRNAQKGKGYYSEVQKVNADEDYYLDELHNILIEKRFTTSPYVIFKITEPKERLIYKLPYFPDRIVQHAVMQICQPIWDKMFIFDSYAAVPGKGIHAGFYRLREFLKNKEETQFCLKMDVSKFYPSIDHDILIRKLTGKIKCKDTLKLLDNVVRSVSGHKGIPIGSYLSQYFSNIYLNDFDHWLKEQIQCKYYIRYCDDAVILHHNKKFLHVVLEKIRNYLQTELRLELNRKTQIFPVASRGIDFLGYKTFHRFSLLRKSSKQSFHKKIKTIEKDWTKLRSQYIISSIMSHIGWLKHCNSYNLLSNKIYNNNNIMDIMELASNELKIVNPIWRVNKNGRRKKDK